MKNRLKKNRNRTPLPIVITGNARSLNNKLEELSACTKHYSEYKLASCIAVSETWFKDSSTGIDIDNYKCIRGDRTDAACKDGGGGVCLYVNNRYCHPNNVYKTGHVCTPNVEILTVTLRPYYLPREFPKVTVNVVYVPCSAHDETAAEIIAETVNQQKTSTPDGVVLLTGDFNTCRIEAHLPQFEQCVTGPTREGNTLDKFLCNIKNSYKSSPLPNLGKSDHIMLYLLPIYKTKLKSLPTKKCTFKVQILSDGCL